MPDQPVPHVTYADVERIVRREFRPDEVRGVLAKLDEYDPSGAESGRARVQLAVLKLAAGNVRRLLENLISAKDDFRDVLAAAEYPGYGSMTPSEGERAPDRAQRRIDADWKQYEKWLGR